MAKENNQKLNKLKTAWGDPRKKAAIKLGLWLLFAFIILLMIMISSRINPQTIDKEPNFMDISKMQEKLLNNNYSYEYNVTANNLKYIFKGDKTPEIEIGYKESTAEIIKYYKKDNNYYKLLVDKYEKINNLYEGIDENLLDLVFIFNTILSEPTVTIEDNIRQLTYKEDNMTIILTTNTSLITKIVIEADNNIYNLSFSNIGKVDELVYPVIDEEQIDSLS